MKQSTPLSIGQIIKIHAELDRRSLVAIEWAGTAPSDDVDLVLAWFREHAPAVLVDPLRSTWPLLSGVLLIIGLVLGGSVMSVALTYTGAYPVNILILLGLFVAIPGLTLVAALIARMTWGKQNPGIFASITKVWGRLEDDDLEFLATNLWRYTSVFYWLSQRLLQRFTLATLFAALAMFTVLIAFSDIAFGWSSTLDIEPASIFMLTQGLSLPWQSFLPGAVPSLELVEASRFFRMNPDNNPALLGQWWPFIGMSILIWGLGPRLLMAFFARKQCHASLREALLEYPEVTALISRLRSHKLTYTERQDQPAMDEAADVVAMNSASVDATIVWNRWGGLADQGLDIGLGATSSDIQEVLARLPQKPNRVGVVVKGWEPPLLEFLDFLDHLRKEIGASPEIVVQPRPLPDSFLREEDVKAWRSTLSKSHDAKLYVEASSDRLEGHA